MVEVILAIVIIIGSLFLGWMFVQAQNRSIDRSNEMAMAQDEEDRERRRQLSKIFSNKELIEKIVSSERYNESAKMKNRRLIEKYDEKTLHMILSKELWVGQTEEQLLDMFGEPDNIKTIQIKTKTKKEYGYGQYSTNLGLLPIDKYVLTVFLENGAVYGWEE